jgi:sterol desaturase/sphingolipid hydroxylase (fatty acid hydroxylase superfamily)
MSIYLVLIIVMAINGGLMFALAKMAHTPLMVRHRGRTDRKRPMPDPEHRRNFLLNSTLSPMLVFAVCFALEERMFVTEAADAATIAWQSLAILALYDLTYYLMHRFAFHGWSVGRKMHGVHHRIRTPYVIDSLYLHPVEMMLGLGLFFLCVFVVGPVSVYTFAVCFFVYSAWNMYIHSACELPFFPFKAISSLTTNHDKHHTSMRGGYYASITPVFDILLGTATDDTKRRADA